MNDLKVDILGANGGLNGFVIDEALPLLEFQSATTILIFELETEPEQNQEALRQVKNKIRVDKFLKAVQHNLPL